MCGVAPEIVGFGAAAERIRYDVICFQHIAGSRTGAPAPVHVAAAAPIALPDLLPDRRRNRAPAAAAAQSPA